VEEFFIEEAQKAGVIKISRSHRYKNPNRLEKQLAPWFSEECYTARSNYKRTKKQLGRLHEKTQNAYKIFRKVCKNAKCRFQYILPDMLKYRPKSFWGMLQPAHSTNPDLPTAALADLNK
jgi:hypothetical protein